MEYESVIGQGVVEILTDEYKIKGLDAIMQNYSDAKTHEYNEKHVKAVTVFKVKVTSITGKQLKKNS
jgi:nitroimidazol reductase NimA-like FMN-containing flavoprotein (pyridoxamine 5'-phosphate oxidase superfamily)